jgi:copper(I)-binding protein
MARKNFAGVAIFTLSALLVSGCALGFNTGTETQQNSGNGRTADVGALQVRNAVVVVDPADTTRASLVMTVINTGETDDELNGIAAAKTVGTEGTVKVALPHRESVSIGYNSDSHIVLTSVSGALEPGMFVNVTLMFASGESIPMSLLVVPNDDIYSDIEIPTTGAAATPAPSAS